MFQNAKPGRWLCEFPFTPLKAKQTSQNENVLTRSNLLEVRWLYLILTVAAQLNNYLA